MSTAYRVLGRVLTFALLVMVASIASYVAVRVGAPAEATYAVKGAFDITMLQLVFPSLRFWGAPSGGSPLATKASPDRGPTSDPIHTRR